MSPGDITPVVLGVTLPSAGTWLFIFIGLYIVDIVVCFCFWFYWVGLGEEQYADPEQRQHMNLGVSDHPFAARMRTAALRLAEPARSRALRVLFVLDVCFWTLTAVAVATMTAYYYFVR